MVEFATCIIVLISAIIKYRAKKALWKFEKDFESEQLNYKLQRNAVICPSCSICIEVHTFEEQLNDKWECPVCRCRWYETYTHDIIGK